MGKWNGYIFVYRSAWKSGQIKYPPFCSSYKKKSRRLFLLYSDPFHPSEIQHPYPPSGFSLPASYTLNRDTFEIGISNGGTVHLPETPNSYETQNGSVRTGMVETQDPSYLPFSQNPKQGLVTLNFRRD